MHYIVLIGGITEANARNAVTLLEDAWRKRIPEITLCISSRGGDVTGGLAIFSTIRALPVPIHTHAIGDCGSVAATIFMAGERRTVSAIGSFTLHRASYLHNGERSPHTDSIAAPFRDLLGWSEDKILEFFGEEERRISPQEGISLGIAHSVSDWAISDGDSVINIAM